MAKDTGDEPAQPLTADQIAFAEWVQTPEGQTWAQQDPAMIEAVKAESQGGGGAPAGAYENPLQTSGYWDDGSKVTLFDPKTGEYITKDVDPDNIFEYNPSGDSTAWGNVDGQRELIWTGDGGYNEGAMVDMGDNNWDWVYGATPTAPTAPPIDHGIDRETGGQKPGDPNWTPPPITDPWAPDPNAPVGEWDGEMPVYFDPTPDDGGGGDPFTPPGDTPPVDWGGADNPLIGYENSTNKDFYQRQFADMRNRGDNEQLRALSSAIRRRDADANQSNEPTGDPWDWMGGSEQFNPSVSTGRNPDAPRIIDSQFEGMNNQEIALATANRFDDKQAKWYQDLLADTGNENLGAATNWANAGYDRLFENTAGSDLTAQNKVYMNELFNVLYPDNSGSMVNGLPVPVGYASPVNASNLPGGGA